MKTILFAFLFVGLLGGPACAQLTGRAPQYPQQNDPRHSTIQAPGQQYPQQTDPRHSTIQAPLQAGQSLSKTSLRDIDRLVVRLSDLSRTLHDEQHGYLEGQRHAEKLDKDVTALEHMAEGLHDFATQADGSPASMLRMRNDTNSLLQLSFRISRTIELTQPWLRGNHAQTGIRQMAATAGQVTRTALQIDSYLPVDPNVIDGQTEILEASIKELHDEFHEHLEGYEVSAHLDQDLEEIETLVEHIHNLAHNQTWATLDLQHLLDDVNEIKQKTAHIESLFVRQSEIGVRTQDWIGIEHSRDAITDVLASGYLLEHMIRKTAPAPRQRIPVDNRPMRDRHGHPINPDRVLDRHAPIRDR